MKTDSTQEGKHTPEQPDLRERADLWLQDNGPNFRSDLQERGLRGMAVSVMAVFAQQEVATQSSELSRLREENEKLKKDFEQCKALLKSNTGFNFDVDESL